MATHYFHPSLRMFLNISAGLLGVITIVGSFALIFWNETHGLHNAITLKPAFSQSQLFVVLLRIVSLLTMVLGAMLLLHSLQALARLIPALSQLLRYGQGNAAFISGLVLWTLATSFVWIQIKPLWVAGLVIIVMGTLYLVFAARKYSKKQRVPKQDKL